MAPKASRSSRRLVALLVLLSLGFGAMAARLVTLQVVQGPAYAELASKQRQRVVQFAAQRGAIFDSSGHPLAISVDLHTVFADPALVENPGRAAARLARVLDQPKTELASALTREGRFAYLARQIRPPVAAAVRRLDLPGVYLETEPKRYYPGGELASHVLGFVDIDGHGLSGIELQYDDILAGRPGRMTIEQDPAGNSLPQSESNFVEARGGRSLVLTLDKDIQYFTEEVLERAVATYKATAGSAIVMRPSSGEILAMANVPSFDSNNPGAFESDSLRNRAVTDQYEPGSVFKLVTASAGIDSGTVKPRTKFLVPYALPYADRTFQDSHVHPTERMTVRRIIVESSNVGTIKIGLRLGGARLDDYVRRFGMGTETGLDFPGEVAGEVRPRHKWSGTTIATIPIGQGIAVTPLQMASAFATVANSGVRVEPKLLDSTLDDEGRLQPAAEPETTRILRPSTARKMTEILSGVVEEGTGVAAQVPGYAVAGKTGTAQKPEAGRYGGDYVASFAGYAPADDPEIVVLVMLDEPSPIWGGLTAAPTFAEITGYALERLGVPPSRRVPATDAGSEPAVDTDVRD